jgi:hypothetical protein
LTRAIAKTNAAIILAVVIVIALAIYYIALQSTIEEQNQNAGPKQTPTPTPTNTPQHTPKATIAPSPTPVSTPTATQNPTPTSTSGNGQLQLTLTIEKTTYNLGEPINIAVTITNISNQTVSYTHTGLDFDFKVYNDTNNLVYQWSNFKAFAQFITTQPLPAGESNSQNFTWQQTCNWNATVQEDLVAPGIYYIVGLTGPTYKMQTTPTEITITNP